MNIPPQQTTPQISPFAILAGILFNINKAEKITVQPDDSSEPVEIMTRCVGLESDGDALVCILPVEKVMHFAENVYDCNVKIDAGHMLVCFEKRQNTPTIYTADGAPVRRESTKIAELIERFK